jgi:hypothetical protein
MGQFDEFDSSSMACAVCEAMCPDAVDGTLSDAEQRAFDKHLAGCVSCAQELAEAQRGAAWMAMLKGHTPEPPAALLQRILAETTGTVQAVVTTPVPVAAPIPSVLPFHHEPENRWNTRISALRRRLIDIFSLENARMGFQPRLAMTAAMAFFSIALTLNMTGIRLSDLRADSLRPSSLRRAVADMGASATRSFQNLRVVYQVESRVNDLRNNDDEQNIPGTLDRSHGSSDQTPDSNGTTTPQDKPARKDTPQGTSELVLPMPRNAALRKGA